MLLESGVNGIALSSSILKALNPIKEMRDIVKMMYKEREITN
jgi:thiamine monophosphate synthase